MLQRALSEGYGDLGFWQSAPFAPLAGDPRYEAMLDLLRRVPPGG